MFFARKNQQYFKIENKESWNEFQEHHDDLRNVGDFERLQKKEENRKEKQRLFNPHFLPEQLNINKNLREKKRVKYKLSSGTKGQNNNKTSNIKNPNFSAPRSGVFYSETELLSS